MDPNEQLAERMHALFEKQGEKIDRLRRYYDEQIRRLESDMYNLQSDLSRLQAEVDRNSRGY